ncbi:MAG: ribonuclease III [Bacteroidota bacterium]
MSLFSRLLDRIHPLRFIYYSQDPHFNSLRQKLSGEGFNFSRFEEVIQYRPRQWKLFLQALLHRSYLQFVDSSWNSNERLEFLGDAVLNMVVAQYLYQVYPSMEEGNLTKFRSRLVNRKVLSQRAKDLQISEFLLLSASAAQSIGGGSESILADAFEAVIGAIYLDGGIKAAKNFVHAALLSNQDVINSALTDDNYKSALLEYSQGRSLGTPRYSVIREEGPEHERRFTVEVAVGTQLLGVGTGRSKKDAEQAAALQALEKVQHHQVASIQRENS